MTTLVVIELILNGLQSGLLLFGVAAGLTLIIGVTGFLNLAHGAFLLTGAVAAAVVAGWTGYFAVGLVASLMTAALLGMIVERMIIRRLYARSPLDQVMVGLALMLLFTEALRWGAGSTDMTLEVPAALAGNVTLPGGVQYPALGLVILAVGLTVALALYILLVATRLGTQLRAAAHDREMAGALGINTSVLCSVVFALGAGLAGLSGALMGVAHGAEIGMGMPVLILAAVVIVIGGIGSLKGAFVAAILVGLTTSFGQAFLPILFETFMAPADASGVAMALAPLLIYVLLAVVLLVRPSGLFGRA